MHVVNVIATCYSETEDNLHACTLSLAENVMFLVLATIFLDYNVISLIHNCIITMISGGTLVFSSFVSNGGL